MSLEKIIRPLQPNTVTPPPRRIISGTGNTVAPVKLQIGRSGTGRTLNGSASSKITVYVDSYWNEGRVHEF